MGQDDLELVPKDTSESNQDEDGEKDKPNDVKKDLEETKEKVAAYKGPENRKGERRKGQHRRDQIRFEQKVDRRSGKDRRGTEGVWKGRSPAN
jgi:hypothetical protein